MARAAFLVDRLMHKFGLHGKSFIPMVIGFGCNVPGIMATRTLDSRRDRLATLLVLPLMSCSARLPIYSLIIPAFFPSRYYARLLLLIYLIGIALAVVAAKLLRVTLLRGEPVPFVMELPPYRVPTFRGILIHMWERSWLYIKKAGTLILGASIVMWFLTSYPKAPGLTAIYDRAVAEAEADAAELSWRLNLGDLSDAAGLCAKLHSEGAVDKHSPSVRIRGVLNPTERSQLAQVSVSEQTLARAALGTLNGLIARRDLFHPQDFSESTWQEVMGSVRPAGWSQLSQRDVVRLNRLLLAEAYPTHISRGPLVDVRDVAADMGLPPESTLVRDALRAISEGSNEADQAARLTQFLTLRNRVLAVRREFADSTAQLGDTPQEMRSLALQKKRDDALSVLKSREPALYAAVLGFVDKLEEPLNLRLSTLAKARQAETLGYTMAGRVGRALVVVLKPLGFDWRIGTALIGSFAAKEVFVAQMGIVFSLGDADAQSEGLRAALREAYTPLIAFCIMLFTLISMPCIATVAVTRRETGSWGWAFFQLGGLTLLAYAVTLVVYQVGTLLQIGVS